MNSIKRVIQKRNELFTQVRAFFSQRDILEVDTPLLRKYTVTDPYMEAFLVRSPSGHHQGYLQTSPEYAMKQLLSFGSGDIFQLSKMFRADEKSHIHASEFTLLEWYRVGFDHVQLIEEVCQFIEFIIGKKKVILMSYQEAFMSSLSIDPFSISLNKLERRARDLLGSIPEDLLFDNYLSLLFSEKVEASFNPNNITVIYGYPVNQASLAKVTTKNGLTTAERFEVYLSGMELANGFNELTDPQLQHRRFEKDNKIREQLGKSNITIDEELMQSLNNGLPSCAGVALGIDRLLMIKLGVGEISDVVLN